MRQKSMSKKVVLILVDGMRPDGLKNCGNPYAEEFVRESLSSLDAKTVMPSVTLPCHMSLFHSVDPDRHGITSNVYTPQVRPIDGLVEQLNRAGRKCAFFYTWEELRDLARPGNLDRAELINLHSNTECDTKITSRTIEYINSASPDFVFLYLGDTDEVGHAHGWMGEEYLACVSGAVDCVKRVREEIPADYTIILTADHGGHGRHHGENIPEDMTIPVILNSADIAPGVIPNASILDIAPTVVKMLSASPAREWEGKSLI